MPKLKVGGMMSLIKKNVWINFNKKVLNDSPCFKALL